MADSTLPESPLYDPKIKVRNFRFEEDYENIRLNTLGKGVLYQDSTFLHYLPADMEWKRPKEICSNPKFIDGKAERFDALQGKLGDCWLVTAMQAITLDNHLVEHVVPANQTFGEGYIGAFHFRIWYLGCWVDVVVDDRLPCFKNGNKTSFAHSKRGDVFWAPLLEKACAKVTGPRPTSYADLAGGYAMTSFQTLSGGIVEEVKLNNVPGGATLKWFLDSALSNNALICGICKSCSDKGLLVHHGYTVTKLHKCPADDSDWPCLFLIRLMNTWGTHEWKGMWSDEDYDRWYGLNRRIRNKLGYSEEDDGEFWMRENDFKQCFDNVHVSHLGPRQYLVSRQVMVNFSHWKATSFTGEWAKGDNAAGSNPLVRHQNPQYKIVINWPENDPSFDGACLVVVELCHMSPLGRQVRPNLAFYIYFVGGFDELKLPLDKTFFDKNRPLNDPPNFTTSMGRGFALSMKLVPGTHLIVPCTENPDQESHFLLRVFAESELELKEHDPQISKSFNTQEVSFNEYDKQLKRIFDVVAKGQEGIDWVGLKDILNKATNPRSYFETIAEFLNILKNLVTSVISSRSSSRSETGDFAFTKDECRSMLAMFDDYHSGQLSFCEVSNLLSKIYLMKSIYEQYEDRAEGSLTLAQLKDALAAAGYDISKRTLHLIANVYQRHICLTDFIMCGLTIETVLHLSQRREVKDGHKVTFTLDEWVRNSLFL